MKQKSTWFDCGFGLAFMAVASWVFGTCYLLQSVHAATPPSTITHVVASASIAYTPDLLSIEDVVYEADFTPAMAREIMERLDLHIPAEGDAAFVASGDFGSTTKFYCHVGDSVVEDAGATILARQHALITSETYEIPDEEGAPIGSADVSSYFFAGKIATAEDEIPVLGLAITTVATIDADTSVSTTVLPIGEAISQGLAGAYVLQMQEILAQAALGTGPPTQHCLPECQCECAQNRAEMEDVCAIGLVACVAACLTVADFLLIGTCMAGCALLPPGLNAACFWGCAKVLAVRLAAAIGACLTLYGACMAAAHVIYVACKAACDE